ncbi:hypothetical protein L210DRAFT_3584522 [Boletus edulis BED1]|uniref:Uncharacterized protein n=1 Tax=Boletus edulis BED1 TaxID=1328754 RepID=A0AAD4BAX1_BOLED|nr:hypothetical protein L210DRAFT_3584522 [Boletus edulis BED1]
MGSLAQPSGIYPDYSVLLSCDLTVSIPSRIVIVYRGDFLSDIFVKTTKGVSESVLGPGKQLILGE